MLKNNHHHNYTTRAYAPVSMSSGIMYLRFNKCVCGLRKAYDLTKDKPVSKALSPKL